MEMEQEETLLLQFFLSLEYCNPEVHERKLTPQFFKGIDMSHSLRWSIILQQEDNPHILDFKKRMRDFNLLPEVLLRHVDKLCAEMKADINESDWQAAFQTLNIRNSDQQEALKYVVGFADDMKRKDEQNRSSCAKAIDKAKACAHLSGFPRGFTREQIEELIKIDGFVDKMENITLLKDLSDATKLKGEVVIIFTTHETAVKFSEKLNGQDYGNYVLHVKVY